MNTCAILPVDKPAGWTSFDVLAKLRGALHSKESIIKSKRNSNDRLRKLYFKLLEQADRHK